MGEKKEAGGEEIGHTPEPWDLTLAGPGPTMQVSHEGCTIARILCAGPERMDLPSPGQAKANGQLIADAPRLKAINAELAKENERAKVEVKRLISANEHWHLRISQMHRELDDNVELLNACSRWLKEYDHPMPSYFQEAFSAAIANAERTGEKKEFNFHKEFRKSVKNADAQTERTGDGQTGGGE